MFDAIIKRQTMANLAKDMDTWIEKRDQLSQKIDTLKKQKASILKSEVCIKIPFVRSYRKLSVIVCTVISPLIRKNLLRLMKIWTLYQLILIMSKRILLNYRMILLQ